MRPRIRRLATLALCVLPLLGQGWGSPPPTGPDPDFSVNNKKYDGRFTYARYRYTPARKGWGGGGGFFGGVNYYWDHDYPRADHHFPVIIDELTTIHGDRDHSNILSATDPELFKYPFAYFCEPGYWTLTDTEAVSLRSYLLKGGFFIVDDFRGGYAFQHFLDVLHQVLPDAQPIELTSQHPIFHSFFEIDSLNRIPPYGPGPALYFGIFEHNDPTQRMMMIVNYDNDISESWEWSDQGFIPIDLTNENYKLGVNYLVYAMTH